MPQFYEAGFCRADLGQLNQCWIFLKVMTLSDICDMLGYYITAKMWTGKPNTTIESGYNWPQQQCSTKKGWICGQIALHSTIHFNFLQHFVIPLGLWLDPTLQAIHGAGSYPTPPNASTTGEARWQVHLPHPNSTHWQCKFHSQVQQTIKTDPQAVSIPLSSNIQYSMWWCHPKLTNHLLNPPQLTGPLIWPNYPQPVNGCLPMAIFQPLHHIWHRHHRMNRSLLSVTAHLKKAKALWHGFSTNSTQWQL